MSFLIFHYESPEPGFIRLTVPAFGLRYAKAGTRVNCRLFWRLCYVATESGAHGRLFGIRYVRQGFLAYLSIGGVYVFRRIAGIHSFRPTTKFF